MKTPLKLTRRDLCFLCGSRAAFLSRHEAATAWLTLARDLETLSERDLPKFRDLITAIRAATIHARSQTTGRTSREKSIH